MDFYRYLHDHIHCCTGFEGCSNVIFYLKRFATKGGTNMWLSQWGMDTISNNVTENAQRNNFRIRILTLLVLLQGLLHNSYY